MIKQLICGNVIMSGVKTEISWIDFRTMTSHIVSDQKEADGIVPASGSELHDDGKFDFMLIITRADHVKSTTEVPDFFATVMTPVSIRVGIVSGTILVIRT